MITVEIRINGYIIKLWKATRIKGKKGALCTYSVNDGQEIIEHHYDDGAEVLAKLMMKCKSYEFKF